MDAVLQWFMFFFLMVATSSLQDQCSRIVHSSVRSSRNRTGHWTTHITLRYDPGPHEMDNKDIPPVSLDLRQCSTADSLSLEQTITTPPSLATPGYGLFPGVGRYKFSPVPAVWEKARQACSGEGSHLAVVRSKEQEDVIKALFARYPNISGSTWSGAAWLGFHDIHHENTFLTVLGEPLTTLSYVRWDSGKPDNKVYGSRTIDSDCGAMLRNGALIDLPCDAAYAYVCEQEIW